MSRRKPADENGNLSTRQMAQRMRRCREAEEAAKFKVPPRGPHYGTPELSANDERIELLGDTMRAELAFAPTIAPLLGITAEQLQRWSERGAENFAGGVESPYANFYDEVQRSAVYVEVMLRRLSMDAKGAEEKKTARWLLERNLPERYALRRDNQAGTDVVTALGDMFEELQRAPSPGAASLALTDSIDCTADPLPGDETAGDEVE
jgi:hypothetical protein